MKKLVVLSAVAVAAMAGSAFGQAQLQLRFVPQTGGFGAATPLTSVGQTVNGPVSFNTTTFRTIRLRVDYRVIDPNAADPIVAGLVSGSLNITAATTGNVAAGNTTVGPSGLSLRENAQTANPNPTANGSGTSSNNWTGNDTTAGPNARTGLAGTFRGGFTDPNMNSDPSNGTVTGLSILNIVPVAISQTHQGEAGYDDGSSGAAFPLAGGEWYTLYVLTVAATSAANGSVTLSAAFAPDAGTGNSFGYFITTTNVPQNSGNSQSASITINIPGVPAPGAMALLGMGGLIAARRRRA